MSRAGIEPPTRTSCGLDGGKKKLKELNEQGLIIFFNNRLELLVVMLQLQVLHHTWHFERKKFQENQEQFVI